MTVDVLIFTDIGAMTFLRTAGAHTIATNLRKHGYSVQVIDHFLLAGLETTLSIIDKFVGSNTLFVGFATTFMNVSGAHIADSLKDSTMFDFGGYIKANFKVGSAGISQKIPISDAEMDSIRNKIKNINPKTHLVMGGTKADYLNQRQIDAFIIGYADNSVIAYAKFLEGKNYAFRYTIINNNQMVVDYDIDAAGYDFPNSTIEYQESDLINSAEVLPIEIARGCIFQCKFCNFRLIGKKKNDYIKYKETIYAELMRNYEKFGTTRYTFADDTYNESIEKLEHFAEVFQRLPFKLEFVTYLRHDLIHRFPEMADLLKESGLKVAVFGIETLNHQAGKIVGKGLHPEKTRETLQWLRDDKGWKNNILMSSGFIVGLPTETRDTVNKWIEELMDFKYPLDSFLINPLGISPLSNKIGKSEFEKNYSKYGYRFDPKISIGWINNHWRVEDTIHLCNKVHEYIEQIGRIRLYGFRAMTVQGYGVTWDEIYNTSSSHFGDRLFYQTKEKAQNYHRTLML